MQIKAKELAAAIGCTIEGNGDKLIAGAAGLEEACGSDISFLGNLKYASLVATTKAGAVIVPEDFVANGRTIIKTKNPQLAFARVLAMLEKERATPFKAEIHGSAVISNKTNIGKDVCIGPFVVVEDGVVIGNGSVIMANCYIGRNTRIGQNALVYPGVTLREDVSVGSNAIIHPGAVIGSDGFGFIPQGRSIFKIPQIGSVEIGDDVEIGANVTIDRATTGATKIGKGTKLDNQVHIAHNIQIGENCLIAGQVGFAGSSKIGNNVMMAGQVGVIGHITIGNGVIIGGKAVVTNDVPDNVTISGYPARMHKENLKLQALVGKLPELFADVKKLKEENQNKKG